MKHVLLGAALLASASTAVLSTAALAQDEYSYKPGDKEFTLSGTGSNDRRFDRGSFGVSAGLSYFLTDAISAGLRQDLSFVDANGSDNLWNGATRASLDYNFDLGRFKPYVGASIGYIYGESTNETGTIGPEVGLKYFLNNTTYAFGQTSYQYLFDDADDIRQRADHGVWLHTVGLGVKF